MDNRPQNAIITFLKDYYNQTDDEHKLSSEQENYIQQVISSAENLLKNTNIPEGYLTVLDKLFANLAEMKLKIINLDSKKVSSTESQTLIGLLDILVSDAEQWILQADERVKFEIPNDSDETRYRVIDEKLKLNQATSTIREINSFAILVKAHTDATVEMIAEKENYVFNSKEHKTNEKIILRFQEDNKNNAEFSTSATVGAFIFGCSLIIVGAALFSVGIAPGLGLITQGGSLCVTCGPILLGMGLLSLHNTTHYEAAINVRSERATERNDNIQKGTTIFFNAKEKAEKNESKSTVNTRLKQPPIK